jgi:hypothetical protein
VGEVDRVPRSGRRNLGCLGAVLAFAWAGAVIYSVSKGCSSPYWRAKRVEATDPCKAAALFAADVRLDTKRSTNSLIELTRIGRPCATRQLIDLMDLPDGRYVEVGERQIIADSVRERTATASRAPPRYDPDATSMQRAKQKAAWIVWFQELYPAEGTAETGPQTTPMSQ